MEPPSRPIAGHRNSNKLVPPCLTEDSLTHLRIENINPVNTEEMAQQIDRSERVGMSWDESTSRIDLEQECIETKIVTTTTTTKRRYPPIQMRAPRVLASLDGREYPLAKRPIPAELSRFSYMVGETTSRRIGNAQKASAEVYCFLFCCPRSA